MAWQHKNIANELQDMKNNDDEIPKNAAVGQSDLFVSICFSSATPGH